MTAAISRREFFGGAGLPAGSVSGAAEAAALPDIVDLFEARHASQLGQVDALVARLSAEDPHLAQVAEAAAAASVAKRMGTGIPYVDFLPTPGHPLYDREKVRAALDAGWL